LTAESVLPNVVGQGADSRGRISMRAVGELIQVVRLRRKQLLLLILTVAGVQAISPSAASAVCPNEALRAGLSAELPDCRAYELVSSPESNGRLLGSFTALHYNDFFSVDPVTSPGDSVIYATIEGPLLAIAEPNGSIDSYRAVRTPTGWQTSSRLSVSGVQGVLPDPGGVSNDHLYAFAHVARTEGSGFAPGELEGGADYLVKPDGSLELTGKGELGEERLAQGRYISMGGEHIIFTTGHGENQSVWCSEHAECKVRRLETDAPPEGTGAIYERSATGPTHVVSLLPGNTPLGASQEALYKGASKDGTAVAFAIAGVLYVHIHSGGGSSDKTVKVAEGNPSYAGLSDDGHYLFYVEGGNIHRFDTDAEEDTVISATGDSKVVNISADGTHVYFISEAMIGGEGVAGRPNVYVWSSGSTKYIATVTPTDAASLTTWVKLVVAPREPAIAEIVGPGADPSRTTPDGNVIAFESQAQLTSYDNEGKTEIYRYGDQDQNLVCVSCNQLGGVPSKGARFENLEFVGATVVINNLSADGSRVFFETEEALVSRDTDGVNDIYEWQQESGKQALISSGQSVVYPPLLEANFLPKPNTILGATPSGSDVILSASEQLLPYAGIGGAQGIYDARIGGGFVEPPPNRICSEEGCHGGAGAPAPSFIAPQSSTINSSGNVRRRKRVCRRSKSHGGKTKHKGCRRHRHHARHAVNSAGEAGYAINSGEKPTGDAETRATVSVETPSSARTDARAAPVTRVISPAEEFGISSVSAQLSATGAASHPDFNQRFVLKSHLEGGRAVSSGRTESVSISLPPGLLGNPNAVLQCETGQLVAFGNCPIEAQVGIAEVLLSGHFPSETVTTPIYNLEPPHPEREVARLGFIAASYPVFIDIAVRTSGDYGVTAIVRGSPSQASLLTTSATLWGDPGAPVHDTQRLTVPEGGECNTACKAPGGKRSVPPTPAFMTNPSACQEGEVGFSVTSYQLPGQVSSANAPLPAITECTGLPFAPSFEAEPTSHVVGAPTGLNTKLVLPQHESPDEKATATMREARVTLPAGMQIASGAANWIGTCSEDQVGYHKEVDAACPDSSKLGTARIISPALSQPLEGTIYQRTPRTGHQLGLWLTSDALGLHIKIPGDLEPDPGSGRLTAVFRDLPQVPVEEFDLDVWGGPRAPLQNPDRCGSFTTDYSFAPHSEDPAASGRSQMQITEGCNRPFSPTLQAGVTDPVAGKFSPLVIDLTREDGQQQLRGFELELPDGELAKLKGVPLCPDVAASSGSCPAASAIGHVVAASGPGPEPLWVPQPGKAEPRIYLAGPYQGSPFSAVTEVPAQAGPFDLGTVVVRSGFGLDPDTNRAVVKADPLPQFFEGIGLAYRRLHVVVDRPGFSLNPTDCSEMQFDSAVTSTQGALAHPAARFQVDGCKALKFKPKLTLKLTGGTKRADYPALTAILKARKGDANIARASVGLPHSEFLAQEHIATICTRKQFAADRCPKGAVYGRAKAWTPLLAKPLEGPVYLRSSSHPLPDLVAALGGELDVNLVGRIDSHSGGIRSTFEAVPDAPVTKFVLKMRGGAKSLFTNSTDICRGAHRATVKMRAQNGRAFSSRPLLESFGCRKHPKPH
jgi:hypothetical protein